MQSKHEFEQTLLRGCLFGCWIAVLLLSAESPALAASSTGVSPIVTVDTRGGGLAVFGRVLDASTRQGVSGAAVSLAGWWRTRPGSLRSSTRRTTPFP